jgi:TRAP transporter TAXI family solute receptor
LLAAAAVCFAGGAQAEQVRLMTGPQGGTWVPLGGQLKAIWEQNVSGLAVQSLPGAGIANVKAIEAGKADLALANTISTVDAVHGNPPFEGAAKNVCHVATLYPQYLHIVALADAGVSSLKDFKGKALTTQPKGNTAEQATRDLMKALGIGYEGLAKVNHSSYTDSVGQLKDGHAQLFTLGTTIPASAVMDLAASRDIVLVPMDDATFKEMKKLNPGYTLGKIPAGTYPKQDKDAPTLIYATHLIASCKLPEAEVYEMTKSMHKNMASLAAISTAMKNTTPKQMAEDIGVPMHPGAKKYFKEIGAL